MKRLFDIIFSVIGLFLLLPLFIVIMILIKLDSHGPVFFAQKRIGKKFKPFNLYKFRATVHNGAKEGLSITADDDPQVTSVGRFLQKTKMENLPQLWNVLKGDMSLIGPKPEVRRYISKYRSDYREILKIRPGLKDVASSTYKNGEAVLKDQKDTEEYYAHMLLPEKIKLSKEYVRKTSLIYDLKLMLFSILNLLFPRNIPLKIIDVMMPYRRPIVIGIQLSFFILSNYLAFFIRFDGNIPSFGYELFLSYLPMIVFLRIIFLFSFSLDRGLWRYASIRDLLNITAAVSIASLLFFLSVRYIFGETPYPKSIYGLDWLLNIFLLGGIRLFRRLHEEIDVKQNDKKRVIVIGAGDAAEMLIRDVEHKNLYPYRIIGLVDDDPKKKGLKIRNIPVLGTRRDLKKIVEREEPEEFLISIPSASRVQLQSIVKELRQFTLPIKKVPSLCDILSGKEDLGKIRTVEPEDILFRAPICDECRELKGFFENKRVMITGAGGSIGSELSRQMVFLNPACLILFERHEESLYKVDMELRSLLTSQILKSSSIKLFSIIGDVLDEKRIDEVMNRFHPEIVLHAAAYKHVPLMENNPYEAFRANVIGTRIVAEKAREFGVERFVLISTDKAVNPINVMGMTKKIAEEIIRYLSEDTHEKTKYIIVRFGNVLESSGSVVPLFREQIKKGGPVTVTHPEITRYFMTITEAVNLVLQATAMGNGKEVFVLDMGKPVKILDLAKKIIGLYGYGAGVGIKIDFVGLRPGEKLHEVLFNSDEVIEKTYHPKISSAIAKRSVNQNILEFLSNPELFRDTSDVKDTLNALLKPYSEQVEV
jgi:FlaA1/EpsC-like NDP-sugar epimerase/lipopolysaccharide/colanic/teichoic acid biosynthesis glycosyltransferase